MAYWITKHSCDSTSASQVIKNSLYGVSVQPILAFHSSTRLRDEVRFRPFVYSSMVSQTVLDY